MRAWFENLSDALIDRLVPKTEAAAATQCWTEEVCQQGPLQLCGSTGRWGYFIYQVCADGTRTFRGVRCARCNG
ncbi:MULTISPECIES: hypothetical protein [unclassified Streptomyces]|uniref:hypothetical protein n=1 Tax=unclassified Streptomyces TaxID=2593676 RepID=UPI003246A847